jgi:hypothetical protein
MLALLLVLASTSEHRPWSPVQLALSPSAQVVSEEDDVFGLRLDLGAGANRVVAGVDLGAVNVAHELDGVQVAVLINLDDDCRGVRAAPVNLATHFSGLELGVVNLEFSIFSHSSLSGVQFGVVNATDAMSGLQVGVYNEAQDVVGLQLGLVNRTQRLRGFQVGLVNLVKDSPLQFFPVLNAHF